MGFKKIFRKFGLHYPWRLTVKFLIWPFFYIQKLGLLQYLRLLSASIKHKKIFEARVKGYKYPMYIRTNTTDNRVFQKVIINEDYNYNSSFKPEYIIDAGANCGFVSLYFANKFPNAKIIAVEPEESNINTIKRNTKKYKNIRIVKGGIWHNDSFIEILNPNSKKYSFRVKECSNSRLKGNNIFTLIKKYNFPRIDILKMDIEGAEKEVLSRNYKKWISLTRTFFLDVHEYISPGVTKILNSRIKEYNLRVSHKGENIILEKF